MTQLASSTSSTFDHELLEASAEDALTAIQRAGDQASELIAAWTERKNAAAVNAVATSAQGPSRKAARRALNVLKSRGVPIPRNARPTSSSDAQTKHEAFLLPPDSAGTVCLVIVKHPPARRCETAAVFLNDRQGIAKVESGEMAQSQLKQALERILPHSDSRAARVPVEWARARIAAARKLHAERSIPEPLGMLNAQSLLGAGSEEVEHPFHSEGLELSEEDAKSLATSSEELHSWPEFRSWLPPTSAADEMLRELGKGMTSDEQLPPEELMERLQEQIKAATDRHFSPQVREELQGVMKDAALCVLQRAGETDALRVVATMKVIDQAGLITDPPHTIGFLRVFFDKAVAVLLSQGNGQLRIPVSRGQAAAPPPDHDVSGAIEVKADSDEALGADAEADSESEKASSAAEATAVEAAPKAAPSAPDEHAPPGEEPRSE